MEWGSFLGGIIGGIISGLFTFLGVKYTIKNQEKREIEKRNLDYVKSRPELQIIDYKRQIGLENTEACNIEIYCVSAYKEEKKNELICHTFKFRNTGRTDIQYLDAFANKSLTFINLKTNNKNARRSIFYYKRINVNEDFTLKICAPFELPRCECSIVLGFKDFVGNFWFQHFFPSENTIDGSILADSDAYDKKLDKSSDMD